MKEDIVETMKIKFGRVIDLDEIQEAYLRRLIFELRMSRMTIREAYEHELRIWQVTIKKLCFQFFTKLLIRISWKKRRTTL